MTELTVPEVAERLRCSQRVVRELIKAPDGIRAAKVAGKWLVSEDDLEIYLESQRNRPKPRQRRRRMMAE